MLVDDSLGDAIGRLRMVAHQVRIHEIDPESAELVGHIFVACADEVVAEVAHFAKRAKELGWRDPIDLHHTPLGGLAAEHADKRLKIFGDPLARSHAIL